MTDWRSVYTRLAAHGLSDDAIGVIAGRTRSVVCRVRNGTYNRPHEPGHEGGERLLARLAELDAEAQQA